MAVRAVAFIGDPEGAQIAFLEDMQHQIAVLRSLARGGMDRPHIAVKHDIGYAFFGDDAVKMRRPFLGRAVMADEMRLVRPEKFVPRVEACTPDLCAGLAQKAADTVEERAMRPLKH